PYADEERSDPQGFCVGELRGGEPRAENADHGKVRRVVTTDDRGLQLGAAVQRDRDLTRRVAHVRVRERVAVGGDDDAAPPASSTADVDDARRDPLDDADDGLRVRI